MSDRELHELSEAEQGRLARAVMRRQGGLSLRVAAVIPCFNSREWLEGCLGSLAAQTRPFAEIASFICATAVFGSGGVAWMAAMPAASAFCDFSTARGEGAAKADEARATVWPGSMRIDTSRKTGGPSPPAALSAP